MHSIPLKLWHNSVSRLAGAIGRLLPSPFSGVRKTEHLLISEGKGDEFTISLLLGLPSMSAIQTLEIPLYS